MTYIKAARSTYRGGRVGTLVKKDPDTRPASLAKPSERIILFEWIHCSACGELVEPPRKGKVPSRMPEHTPPRGSDLCTASGESFEGTVTVC